VQLVLQALLFLSPLLFMLTVCRWASKAEISKPEIVFFMFFFVLKFNQSTKHKHNKQHTSRGKWLRVEGWAPEGSTNAQIARSGFYLRWFASYAGGAMVGWVLASGEEGQKKKKEEQSRESQQ
jgi:hypothetical protein